MCPLWEKEREEEEEKKRAAEAAEESSGVVKKAKILIEDLHPGKHVTSGQAAASFTATGVDLATDAHCREVRQEKAWGRGRRGVGGMGEGAGWSLIGGVCLLAGVRGGGAGGEVEGAQKGEACARPRRNVHSRTLVWRSYIEILGVWWLCC
jgi:hypothetical protein